MAYNLFNILSFYYELSRVDSGKQTLIWRTGDDESSVREKWE